MAKKMSKPLSITIAVILALGFIVLSLFTFGQFELKRGRKFGGIISLVEVGSDINNSVIAQYTLKEEEGKVERSSIEKSVNVIRNRLNITEFATSKVKATNDGFIVELPNSQNASFATQYLFGKGEIEISASTNKQVYLTHEDITGAKVTEAYAQDGGTVSASGYAISINFTPAGKEKFFEATTAASSAESDKAIIITMDGVTLSQANVSEPMHESSVQISGAYSKAQLEIIASAINGGLLENAFELLGNQKVTSTVLGDKAELKITLGLLAILVLVAVLFVVFYKNFGLIADLVLFVSVVLFAVIYAVIPGTMLTIPALIGMVIAFVVLCALLVAILERIKAEYALGKTINSSINYAFKKSYMLSIDVAFIALTIFLACFFIVGAYLKTLVIALSVALAVVAATSWLVTRGIIALFKGFVKQDSFYNLVKEEDAE